MTPTQTVLFGVAAILIGLSKGGLGGPFPVALVAPLLSLVMPPQEAVPLMVPMLIFADFFAMKIYWRKWDAHLIRLMLPLGIVGVVMGGVLLARLDATILKVIIILSTLLIIGYRFAAQRLASIEYKPQNWHGYLAGWSSAVGSTLANAGAPTFTIYLLLQNVPPIPFIGTTTLFFAVLNWVKIPIFIQQDLLDIQRLLTLWWVLPLIPISVWVGRKSLDWIDQQLFERILLALLLVNIGLLMLSL